ncbi:Putative ATP binding protein [Dictyocaulus viviparus]|uniref:GPN-loop GTPase 2 n=1 Tax=Dictyocaulus viviparus TaxID=29172 RepID=A0A0D8Y5S2_DICVI|nr:Putative ATP binding protein [Dictyocaulus viviparus]
MYGILVIGAPGAGKSTFCAGLADIFEQMSRPYITINLDPANDFTQYTAACDLKELITVEEVMNKLNLGPNGALKYCIDTLCKNEDWLYRKILDNRNKYMIIDCPGQLELYKCDGELYINYTFKLIRGLEHAGVRLCAVHLVDALYCSNAANFISVVMSTLATMVTMEMPQVNVLSKSDLFDHDASFNLEFFTELPDVNRLLDLLNEVAGLERYHALNAAICDIVSNFDLVSFVPLNVQKKDDMVRILRLADTANGWAFHEHGDIRELIINE